MCGYTLLANWSWPLLITAKVTDYRYALQQNWLIGHVRLPMNWRPMWRGDWRKFVDRHWALIFWASTGLTSPTGEVYCFEVNPCPAYTYYESYTSQPIAAWLAEYLSGHDNYYRRVWNL